MTAAHDVRAVATTVFRLWVREVARLAGSSPRSVIAGAAVSLLVAAAVGALLAVVASAELKSGIPVELRAAVLRTSFSGAALTAGAVGVILCLSVPARTALQNLLDLLPVSTTAARIGQLIPLFAAGLVYSATLTSTAVFVIVRTSVDPGQLAVSVVSYAAMVVVVLVLAISVFTLAQSSAARWLRLPTQYAATVGGIVALGATLAATVPDILTSTPTLTPAWSLAEVLPARAFSTAAAGVAGWGVPVAAGWLVAGGFLGWLSARYHAAPPRARQPRLLHGTRPAMRTPWWGQLWAETLTAVRNPQFAMTVLLLPLGVAGATSLRLVPAAAQLAAPVAQSLAVFPLMLALYAVGRTTSSRWVGESAGLGAATRVLATPVALAVTGGVLSLLVGSTLLMLGLATPADLPDLAARATFALLLALTVGAVIPYSEQQPLSSVAGGFLLAVLYMATTLTLGLLTQGLAPGTGALLTLGAAAVAGAAYAVIARRHASAGPARA